MESLVEAALRVLNTADPFEKAKLGDSIEEMPVEFFTDFVKVAQDEGRHFVLLAATLEEMGLFYGVLPAHVGLWDSARGLHVLPTTIARFYNGGDEKTAGLLESVVYPEEITHCAAGVKWFRYLFLREIGKESKEGRDENEDDGVIEKFHEVVRKHFRGPLKPPFNEEAREAAGFGLQWYEPLAVKESKTTTTTTAAAF